MTSKLIIRAYMLHNKWWVHSSFAPKGLTLHSPTSSQIVYSHSVNQIMRTFWGPLLSISSFCGRSPLISRRPLMTRCWGFDSCCREHHNCTLTQVAHRVAMSNLHIWCIVTINCVSLYLIQSGQCPAEDGQLWREGGEVWERVHEQAPSMIKM